MFIMDCSQNWKKLKQELKVQNSYKRKPFRPRGKQKISNNESQNVQSQKKKRKVSKNVITSGHKGVNEKTEIVFANHQSSSLKKSANSSSRHTGIFDSIDSKKNSDEIWFDTDNAVVRDVISEDKSDANSSKEDIRNRELIKPYASDELTKVSV